jgi:uncharacterized membrane protein
MAGIGFQLKALFKEKSLSNKVKAYVFSGIVASGPWIAAVITVNIILFLARFYLESTSAQSLFLGTIVYTFVFSQILTAPWQMIITRFYSDRLFEKDYDAIKPAFTGLNRIIFFLSFFLVIGFYFNKPLPLYYKILAGYLFILLALIWILMVSLSSIKDYTSIALAYIIGGIISVALTVYLLNHPIQFSQYIFQSNILLSYIIGLSITYVMLMYSFLKVFHYGHDYHYDFLKYLSLFPSLFYTGLFYTLGLWIDDIIMWLSIIGVDVIKTYKYAPVYDNAVFLAYLTIVPSTIMFLVIIETSLYDRYKKYYNYVNGEGNLEEIETARLELQNIIKVKLFHSFQVQSLITLTIVLFSKEIFKLLNLSIIIRNIFRVTVFGALFNIFILHIILILLYFEFRKSALSIAVTFFLSNALLTSLFANSGIEYFGYGFTLSSLLTLIISLVVISRMFKGLTERTYLSQPLANIEAKGFFVSLSRLIRVYTHSKKKILIN